MSNQCPKCRGDLSVVIDSRDAKYGRRRRRECLRKTCGYRWTTTEVTVRESVSTIRKELGLEYRKQIVNVMTEQVMKAVAKALQELTRKTP